MSNDRRLLARAVPVLVVLQLACAGDRSADPTSASLGPAGESSVVVAPAGGVRGANAAPRLVLRTIPALNRATDPPTLAGEAPFTVQLNLCNSDDADTSDSLNWQFHFGDALSEPFRPDGTFNPDFDQYCRVEHTYREGSFTATLSVTDKHLEDQGRGVVSLARTTLRLRIVSFVKPPPEPSPVPGPPVTTLPGSPSITSFIATSPGPIVPGFGSNLVWTTLNATACSIDNGIGVVPCNGSTFVAPLAASTTYTLTAAAPPATPATATATVTVDLPVITFTALSPINVGLGSNLNWSMNVSGSLTCAIDNGVGTVSCFSGFASVSPLADTTYTLTVSVGGTPIATATTTVVVIPPVITSFIATSPGPILLGLSSDLVWSTTGAGSASCAIDNGVGPVSCNGGTVTVTPLVTTTYTLTVSVGATTLTTATASVAVQ